MKHIIESIAIIAVIPIVILDIVLVVLGVPVVRMMIEDIKEYRAEEELKVAKECFEADQIVIYSDRASYLSIVNTNTGDVQTLDYVENEDLNAFVEAVREARYFDEYDVICHVNFDTLYYIRSENRESFIEALQGMKFESEEQFHDWYEEWVCNLHRKICT